MLYLCEIHLFLVFLLWITIVRKSILTNYLKFKLFYKRFVLRMCLKSDYYKWAYHISRSSNPKLDTRISFVPPSSATLVLPPLKSESGWTGELWSNRILIKLIFFTFFVEKKCFFEIFRDFKKELSALLYQRVLCMIKMPQTMKLQYFLHWQKKA